MNNETAAKTPVAVTILAVLLGLAAAGLVIAFAGPYVVDFYWTVWTSVWDAATWVFDHTVLPLWDLLMTLFG